MEKENNKYTPKYFKKSLPEWKRKKDSLVLKAIYRPLSFFTASSAAKLGIQANTVSYFSILIAISACILISIPNHICNILGAIFVSIWLLLDCTDGNLARSVKKQAFGEFADAASSYILVCFLNTSLGIAAYVNNGLIIEKGYLPIVILGCLASSADTLMRLIYQKYKNTERELVDKKMIEIEKDNRMDENHTDSFIVRMELEFGTAGILPLLILICSILKIYDVLVIYCFAYYFLSSVIMISKYIIKAIKKTKKIENDN